MSLAASGGGGGGAAAAIAAVARTCHAPHAPGHDLRRAPLSKALLERFREMLETAGFHKKQSFSRNRSHEENGRSLLVFDSKRIGVN